MTKTLTESDLTQFIGSEVVYTNPSYGRISYTEGARYVAEAGEAWWLLDLIVSHIRTKPRLRQEAFQVWTLTVKADHTGLVRCTDGNHTRLASQRLPYTDFPLATMTL